MNVSYHSRHAPDLSPPRSRIAVRPGIEHKQDTQIFAATVGAELFHVVVARTFDAIDERPSEGGAKVSELSYARINHGL